MMRRWPRYGVVKVAISSGWHALIYERRDESGHGRCASLYHGGIEVMRCDLFDPAHVHTRQAPSRRYYPVGLTLEGYADLALADMRSVCSMSARKAMAIRDAIVSYSSS